MKFLNYIASCSCGNDSMAMVYELIKRNYPLDEVVRYNNGMDFSCVDNLWERLKLYCEPKGIICTELKPKMSFEYKMFEKKVQEKMVELILDILGVVVLVGGERLKNSKFLINIAKIKVLLFMLELLLMKSIVNQTNHINYIR